MIPICQGNPRGRPGDHDPSPISVSREESGQRRANPGTEPDNLAWWIAAANLTGSHHIWPLADQPVPPWEDHLPG
ncbi:hypothetical protein FCM35_KLT05605 [Carex littledalei]|uniref:Uncharacterized protein n=1 Tax=Carex littledalei TaxID=544730 RepID=A0A833V8B5_9POAL|nr:hypothetical protein FCM35_KLT05605 [Carex littledalei]